jgi:hypothetical protein
VERQVAASTTQLTLLPLHPLATLRISVIWWHLTPIFARFLLLNEVFLAAVLMQVVRLKT